VHEQGLGLGRIHHGLINTPRCKGLATRFVLGLKAHRCPDIGGYEIGPLGRLHGILELLKVPIGDQSCTLDLDLIFHGDVALATPELTLPHPRWHERAFVLQPLAEVWPERVSDLQLVAVQDQPIQRILP
jgi:hypothetical protein